jgi:hypothetical protein
VAPTSPSTAQHRACETFEAEQRTFVESVRVATNGAAPTSLALDALGRCWPTSRGAWAISVDKPIPPGGHLGRWSIVHLDVDGARTAIGPTLYVDHPPKREDNLDLQRTTLEGPLFFDFDGDGEVEMFLRVAEVPDGIERRSAGRIWSFHRIRGVERYAPARDLDVETLRDVDADGRPDVITYAPYSFPAGEAPCGFRAFRAHGPAFVAHALADGTFSRDDAIARAEALRACPSKPSTLVATVDGVEDPQQTANDVACARMHGATIEEVDAAIDVGCGAQCGPLRRCVDASVWKRFAACDPPSL